MNQKLIAIILLVIGELLTIAMELYFAYYAKKTFTVVENILAYAIIFLAGICLVHSYRIGKANFSTIWIIVALSICFILVIEPLLTSLFFEDKVTLGSKIGFVLGVIGMTCTITLK